MNQLIILAKINSLAYQTLYYKQKCYLAYQSHLINKNKWTMRIMQLYRIQSDYKNHKKRLDSIKKLDSKEKIARITSHQFYVASQHKKIRINAEIFHEKEEISRRQHTLSLMHKTISDHSKKIKQQYELTPINIEASMSGQKYLRKPNELDQLESENAKMNAKILNARSIYKSLRKSPDLLDNNLQPDRQRSHKNDKQKLMALLKTQFKLQPTVVFPKSKPKPFQTDSEEINTKKQRNQSSLRSLQVPIQ